MLSKNFPWGVDLPRDELGLQLQDVLTRFRLVLSGLKLSSLASNVRIVSVGPAHSCAFGLDDIRQLRVGLFWCRGRP